MERLNHSQRLDLVFILTHMDFLDNELKAEHFLLDTRVCKECGQEKSLLADFYRCRPNASIKSSYSYQCKECSKKRVLSHYYKKSFRSIGSCVICKASDVRLVKDRCKKCDKVLTTVNHDIQILKSMIEYIHKNTK